MSAKKNIIIDGVNYSPVIAPEDEAKRIVIVDNRGLTFVGDCSLEGDGEWITIRGAKCVIYWGTTKHIAEIAPGPTAKTRLGCPADVTVRRDGIVAVYLCGEGWE